MESAATCKMATTEELNHLQTIFKKAGYVQPTRIANTLQGCVCYNVLEQFYNFMYKGSIWRTVQAKTGKSVVAKVTKFELHSRGAAAVVVDGKECEIKSDENILKEREILMDLCAHSNCPDSMIKYVDSFRWYSFVCIIICTFYVHFTKIYTVKKIYGCY